MTEREQLEQAIKALESQRATLGDAVVAAALGPMHRQLTELELEEREPAPQLVGERKLVTVMFADISGFTALAETMDPEALRDLMNACFDQLVPIVEKYEGTVDKFIGDEIMALFGAPVSHENDPELALHAALEMRDTLSKFNMNMGTDLGLHFGINTGLVIAGYIGTRGRKEYSVMGDTVNLAARLEDASERGEIFIGPDTHYLTASLFEFETLEPILVKGKVEPVQVYRLMSAKAFPGRVRGIKGLRSSLIGRKQEIAQLQTALQALKEAEGKGGKIAIVGEPGLGKSRLVSEARQGLPEGITWVEGRALSYSEDRSYWLARDILCGLVGITPGASPVEIGTMLRGNLERLFSEKGTEIYPYLARLMDVPLEIGLDEKVKDLPPETLQGLILSAFNQYVRAQSLIQPLVLVWEDLHWVDPSSLNLMEGLLPLTDEMPLLMLFIFRPRSGRVWAFHQKLMNTYNEAYLLVELSPLTRDDSGHLLQNLIKAEDFSEETNRLILDKAEGNPFFVEELLRSLMDAGLMVHQGNQVILTQSIEEINVPDTLQGIISARIDRLPSKDKQTLQTASVIGRVFQGWVLAHMLEQDQAKFPLDTSLAELQRLELLQQQDTQMSEGLTHHDEPEYSFQHVITQEVTYNSLLISRRKTLHKFAAEAIKAHFSDHLDEQSAILAYHYERAEIFDRAIYYLNRSADRAKAIYANEEAIAFYHSAINQVTHLLQGEEGSTNEWQKMAAQLHESLGDVLELTGQHDEARVVYQKAVNQIPKPDLIWRSRLHCKIGEVWRVQRRYAEALQACELAETTLGQEPADSDPKWWQAWIDIQNDQMMLHYWQNQLRQMTEVNEKIRPFIEQYGTPAQRSIFFQGLVMAVHRRVRYGVSKEVLANAQAALIASQESGNLGAIAISQFTVGFTYLWNGNLNQAEEHLQISLKLTEKMGSVEWQSRCLTYLAVIHRKRGEVEEARQYILQTLEIATKGQMFEYIATARANLSWVAWREESPTQVKENGQSALELWQQMPLAYPFQWTTLWPLISVELDQGQISKAVHFVRALLAPSQQCLPNPLEEKLKNVIKTWESDDSETTRIFLNQAIELAQELGYL